MTQPTDDVAKIAAGLTRAQHTACWNLKDGEWKLAPHDGWRRAGQACSSLCKIGLAQRASPGTRIADAPAYRLTSLGEQVRAYLIAQEQG